jgi:hypothetical protein
MPRTLLQNLQKLITTHYMSKHSLRIGNGKFGTKEDKLLAYAQGDISGKFLKEEITHVRATNIYISRIDKNGYIVKGRENRFTGSNDFSGTHGGGTWGHAGLSRITKNKEGYDGTNDATFLDTAYVQDSSRKQITKSGLNISHISTVSIYAKAVGYDFFHIRYADDDTRMSSFNIRTGEVVATGKNVVKAEIEEAGNGYFRCISTVQKSGTTTIRFAWSEEATELIFVGEEGKGVLVQDAQLERGLTATKYLESSNTVTGKGGILVDEPRIDYRHGKPQLLLEPQRTNLITFSEYHDPSLGNYAYNSILDLGYMAPDGTKSAYRLRADNSNKSHFMIKPLVTGTALNKYCMSVFVKAGNGVTHAKFGIADQQSTTNVAWSYFSITGEGAVGDTHQGGTGEVFHKGIQKLRDGWFRIYVVGRIDNTKTKPVLFMAKDGSDPVYFQDPNAEMFVYGFQMEDGLYPTSYIPTDNFAATRVPDDVSPLTNTSTNLITNNYTTTVVFKGINYRNFGNTRYVTMISDATNDPRVLLYTGDNKTGGYERQRIYAQFRRDNNDDHDVSAIGNNERGMVYMGDEFSALLRLNDTKMALYVNGIRQAEATIAKQDDIENIDFSQITSDLGFYVTDLQVFPFSLTNKDCEVITSKATYSTFADMSRTLKYES